MFMEYLNPTTTSLPPYPMEELRRIKEELVAKGQIVYDFGTGDPRIPVDQKIISVGKQSMGEISQYPSVRGIQKLREAQFSYLETVHNLKKNDSWEAFPTRGSKEAIFHVALSLINKESGRDTIAFPNPGYPVYRSSVLFAGGNPYEVKLQAENRYQMQPWTFPKNVVSRLAAIWVNYPHNPTGVSVDRDYWEKLIAWCHQHKVLLLSDDCYLDIFAPNLAVEERPINPLTLSCEGVVSFMSLSKRSGLTGHRIGMMAGDAKFLNGHIKARANFGCAIPEFIQEAGAVAWGDEEHVQKRREIFHRRLDLLGNIFLEKGLIKEIPKYTFYLWVKIPASFGNNDVEFCLDMAKKGVLSQPSSWLGDGCVGYMRFAMVPNEQETAEAIEIIKNCL